MSDFVKVYVSHPEIDFLHLSREANPSGPAWKSDGFKGDKHHHGGSDLWYQEFHLFLAHVSEFISEDACWTDGYTGDEISAWKAIVMLASKD